MYAGTQTHLDVHGVATRLGTGCAEGRERASSPELSLWSLIAPWPTRPRAAAHVIVVVALMALPVANMA